MHSMSHNTTYYQNNMYLSISRSYCNDYWLNTNLSYTYTRSHGLREWYHSRSLHSGRYMKEHFCCPCFEKTSEVCLLFLQDSLHCLMIFRGLSARRDENSSYVYIYYCTSESEIWLDIARVGRCIFTSRRRVKCCLRVQYPAIFHFHECNNVFITHFHHNCARRCY